MKTARIYLETTLFNYYFDVDRDAHLDTISLFAECAKQRFEPYTSIYVIDELEDAPRGMREKMIELVDRYNIAVLPTSEEAENLARRYLAEGALPRGSLTDASHIACATVNGLDMIVSLNFRHIVRERTAKLTSAVNALCGYGVVEIYSPMEVIDDEETRYHLGRDSRDATQD